MQKEIFVKGWSKKMKVKYNGDYYKSQIAQKENVYDVISVEKWLV